MAKKNMLWRALLPYILLLSTSLILPSAQGQSTAQGLAPTEQSTILNAPPASADPYGRETPRGLATGLVGAFASGDYRRAGHYLEAPTARDEVTPEVRAELAQQLQRRLDSGGSLIPFTSLSNESAGTANDGLPIDQERIGALRTQTGELALIARRLVPARGAPYWVVSAASLKAVTEEKPAPVKAPIATVLPAALTDISIAGAPMADWFVLTVVAIVAFLGMRLVFAILLRVLRAFVTQTDTHRGYQFAEAAFPPLSLYLAVILFFVGTQELQVAIVARQVLARYATIIAWVAFVWLLWRLIDMVADLWSARMARSDRRQAMAALTFVRRSTKSALGVAAFVAVLDTMNINVTTGIAALGLGGLAIALGAQKTIENLVGSLTVILDQPVRVGDFCKVGEVLGTVEDIGMRSTRLRTLGRTVVTIPNGNFASQQIENYSRRDRFLFNTTVGLTYDTSAAQMSSVLEAIRTLLTDDANVSDEARVRFIGFSASALDIEIFAYILTVDYPTFLGMREEILLKIMDTIAAEGVSIAFPTQTVVLKAP
ncbi:MAG: MscS family membrane protein [Janthinobacterium sp.]|jgi:MscS family membrane protein